MVSIPPGARERVDAAVAEAEGLTSAELVVVWTPAAGSYLDVDQRFGLAVGVGLLGWILFGETVLPPEGVIPALVLAWLGGWWVSAHSPLLRRWGTTPGRRREQAAQAARLAFLEQGVDRTRARTGALVHVSFLEERVDLVVDQEVEERLLPHELAALAAPLQASLRDPAFLDAFCRALVALGRSLGEELPWSPDDLNELPDAPILTREVR